MNFTELVPVIHTFQYPMGYIRYIIFQTTEQLVVVVEDHTIMKNINSFDRFSRLVFGLVTIELAVFWQAGTWLFAAYAAGAILVLTAVIRFCPITFSSLS